MTSTKSPPPLTESSDYTDVTELIDSTDLIITQHSPLHSPLHPPHSPPRRTSPPPVVKSEYIVKEYHGVPKPEKTICLIEKKISYDPPTRLKEINTTANTTNTTNTTNINKNLVIGGGIIGALFGAYFLAKSQSYDS